MATRTVEIKGGDKLKKALDAIAHRLGHGSLLTVGFLSDATYPAKIAEDIAAKRKPRGKNGAQRQAKAAAGGLHVAEAAFYNEFGTTHTPARPFFRNMLAKETPKWARALGLALKNNRYEPTGALTAMGHGIKDALVVSILETNDPPNSKRTIAVKGFDKPLIDTGTMVRSVDFVVETK